MEPQLTTLLHALHKARLHLRLNLRLCLLHLTYVLSIVQATIFRMVALRLRLHLNLRLRLLHLIHILSIVQATIFRVVVLRLRLLRLRLCLLHLIQVLLDPQSTVSTCLYFLLATFPTNTSSQGCCIF